MVMVRHKKELTGNGVSQKSSIGKEKKHKRTNALVSGCKCCMKLWLMAIYGLEHMGYVDCRHVAGWQHQWPPFLQFGDTLKGSRV
jgi:hypothetical protein